MFSEENYHKKSLSLNLIVRMGRHKKTFTPRHQIIFAPNLIFYVLNFSHGKFTKEAESMLLEISKLRIKYKNSNKEKDATEGIAKDNLYPGCGKNDQCTKYFSSCYDNFNFDEELNDITDSQLDHFTYEDWDQ